ncbi:TorD/DmsD family molecular chaperone [Sporomusa malonica]|uniref:TorD/DmsD family molecular chaperone n=1 Tax=Sporomusa malonica TaxID=112901 RepID=UPI001FE8DFDE|nr:molecular chaperone TorD family protein [Sporomusa malonica]
MAKRLSIYSLFKQYYQGSWGQAEKAIEAVQEYMVIIRKDYFIYNADYYLDDEVEYEYNRLFVGPAKLLAPPFESAYLNAMGLVMQNETLAVRNFYRKAGLEVGSKNVIPDDHLGLELEFICYLLSQAGQRLAEEDLAAANCYLILYRSFFEEHIRTWVYQHCQDVLTKGKVSICSGTALALTGFLQSEETELYKEGVI